MALFGKKKDGGFMDQIRCDETSYLIWKWHPKGIQKGENNRENSIRFGSSLRVKEGEVAVFVYKQKDGEMQDFIVGPFDQIIHSKNLPVLSRIIDFFYEGETPFQAEIYFINLAKIIQIKFAVPFFDVYDSRFEDFGVPVAVRGSINFKITDYHEFIKLHRLDNFNLENFKDQVQNAIIRYVKDIITNVSFENSIPLVQIETKIKFINDEIENFIKNRFKNEFGVDVSGVDISNIELDKTSDGYKQLMSVTKDISGAISKAEAEAKLKNIAENQRIEMENKEERLRIQREEEQYSIHKQTQSDNIGALQVEKQTEVGVAAANALGKMGENNGGNIDLGSNGIGFNPATIMTEMTLGGVIGQNIANTMNGIMSNTPSKITQPQIPEEKYNIVINGQSEGPFDLKELQEMISNGSFTKDSLVWKPGMDKWVKAELIEKLKKLFAPPIPKENN